MVVNERSSEVLMREGEEFLLGGLLLGSWELFAFVELYLHIE